MNSKSKRNLKAGIYDPYLDTLGGGERYVLTVAESLSALGYDVDLFWSGDQSFLTKAADRFSLNLSNVGIVNDIFGYHPHSTDMLEEQQSLSDLKRPISFDSRLHKFEKFINRIKIMSDYDIFFYLSDGSLPFLFAKKNIVHFQVPFIFKFSLARKLINTLKFTTINKIVCNSQFTSKVFSTSFNHQNQVLYPPVDIEKFKSSSAKENIILNVGRFDNLLNTKKQDVLIKAFSQLVSSHPNLNWRLILAGGSKENPASNKYLQHLKSVSANLPIDIIVNPAFDQLVSIYSKSKIYWHAAGYGVNQSIHPENTEHFGITVVEAMSSGLVPIVVNRGGLPEIIVDGESGYLWETVDDLCNVTLKLISSPDSLYKMSASAQKQSTKFSKQIFTDNLIKIIK